MDMKLSCSKSAISNKIVGVVLCKLSGNVYGRTEIRGVALYVLADCSIVFFTLMHYVLQKLLSAYFAVTIKISCNHCIPVKWLMLCWMRVC